MALLVNYEGTYLPPQKLWYLVDGVWKEVVNVFENNAQQEVAVLDQERIKQDQLVSALITKEADLLARIDGSNPTVPLETDPAQIESLLNEINTIELQLSITKTEQVVLTKKLFEAKAQMEYLKLVTEGEQALERIAKQVINPAEWGVIRIAPQSTLDERLEVVIQHGLDTNDRIFNYGLVYYRLYKIGSADQNDDLNYLKDQFKRRLNKSAFELGTEPTNYVFTIDNIQNVYMEVNQFVNSGAQRIEDYLTSIKDQQKFILDAIEDAKVSMVALQAKVDAGTLIPVDGKIMSAATKDNLQVPIGDVLLSYQNVTTFDQLVSTSTLQDIAAGTKDVANYPGIVKLNSDATSLNEKLGAVQNFLTTNSEIQKELTTGEITFNLNILSTKKATLTPSKLLFWSSQLGDTTVAKSGGSLVYAQTYSSNGAYKFTSDELVMLSTRYIAIINTLLANTKVGEIGVTIGQQPAVRIIQTVESNTIILAPLDIDVEKETKPVSIVSKTSSNTKETGPLLASFDTVDYGNYIVSVTKANTIEDNTGISEYLNCVKANDKAQPHPNITFVYRNNNIIFDWPVILDIEHPTINSLFYANIVEYPLNSLVKSNTEPYLYEFGIRQLNKDFSDSILTMPILNIATDNITPRETFISVFKECSFENTISLSLPSMMPLAEGNLVKDSIISFIECSVENEVTLSLPAPEINVESIRWFIVNAVHQPLPSQMENSVKLFNLYEDSVGVDKLNGYAQKTNYVVTGTDSGLTKIKLTDSTLPFGQDLYNEYNTILKYRINVEDTSKSSLVLSKSEHNFLCSQTGLMIEELGEPEFINIVTVNLPKISSISGTSITDASKDKNELINVTTINHPLISTNTGNPIFNINSNENSLTETLNVVTTNTPLLTVVNKVVTYDVTTDVSYDIINKDISKIVVQALQLNPGVVLE